jgi:hypothetical protein
LHPTSAELWGATLTNAHLEVPHATKIRGFEWMNSRRMFDEWTANKMEERNHCKKLMNRNY